MVYKGNVTSTPFTKDNFGLNRSAQIGIGVHSDLNGQLDYYQQTNIICSNVSQVQDTFLEGIASATFNRDGELQI